MSSYQLKIKLQSDLCVSDGGVYNSVLDTDICHDSYGFPFIPGKRIRGCLRECALELNDWGMNIEVGRLFGDKGAKGNQSKVRVSDACLENYREMLSEAKSYTGSALYHPQNILNHYSYIRTQTGIDYDTGVADATSLRTMRVANKELVFISQVELSDDKYAGDLKACCETLTNMGVGRTRGLGEISAELLPVSSHKADADEAPETNTSGSDRHVKYREGAVRLDYELTLEEPVICKSTNGGESKSLDYIDGGKLLGLVVQQLKNENIDIAGLLNEGELFCSNAYISDNDERCLEVPANYYSIKNDKKQYVEKLRQLSQDEQPEKIKKKQLNMMKHCYIRKVKPDGCEEGLVKVDVGIEERYHHRRPDDKSIGRAAEDSTGDSRFYQMSSIEAGQRFRGYITGTAEQIATIYQSLSERDTVYLGYSHSSEYGKTHIRITSLSMPEGEMTVSKKEFLVKLEAPTLIYNDRAFYSTDVKDLEAEIQCVLGIDGQADQIEQIDRFVNYTTVGGYNVTWNARKPMVEAFDKGTVLHYQMKEPVSVTVPENFLIGERISEGFGEASISFVKEGSEPYQIREYVDDSADIGTDVQKIQVKEGSLSEALCTDLFEEYVRLEAVGDARRFFEADLKKKNTSASTTDTNDTAVKSVDSNNTAARSTVSNMLLMCKEFHTLEQIKAVVKDRFEDKTRSETKGKKSEIANKILSEVKKNGMALLSRFCGKYEVEGYICDQDQYECMYLEAFLQQLKYSIRQEELRKGESV